jgi:5-(carboxyamino)imidazole ribonucleotide mutase
LNIESGLVSTKASGAKKKPLVAVVMGSQSDWETMSEACDVLNDLEIPNEARIVSAHRTPKRLYQFAEEAKASGIQIIIAGAGGAAHLPGMIASITTLPVLGVPVESKHLKGMDSLLSIVQMPGGVPVGTLAIGKAGARNAGILAASILSLNNPELDSRLQAFRAKLTESVAEVPS